MKNQAIVPIFFLFLSPFFLLAQTGCVSGDCIQGFGHYQWQTGERYVGNWQDQKMQGYGVMYWRSGKKYVGQWENNKMQGEGTMFYANGYSKSGLWSKNIFVQLQRPQYLLSESNWRHGEQQLQQLLKDRPTMQQLIHPEDSIYRWIVRKFAGEDTHSLVYWKANSSADFPVPTGVNAAHRYPTATQDGAVWVKLLDNSEEMWAGLIFELFNIQNFYEFQQIGQDVLLGKCTKQEYIMRYARLEYEAVKQTAHFYNTVWKSHCTHLKHTPNPQFWFVNVPPTFQRWIAQYTEPEGYPYHPYSAYYDQLIEYAVRNY